MMTNAAGGRSFISGAHKKSLLNVGGGGEKCYSWSSFAVNFSFIFFSVLQRNAAKVHATNYQFRNF